VNTNVASRIEEEQPIICSWCKKIIGTKQGLEGPSHGICQECKDRHFPPAREDESRKVETGTPIQMRLLCFKGTELVAIRDDIDRLTNREFKTCLDHQRALGRTLEFELSW
jgi:hypothetical protein